MKRREDKVSGKTLPKKLGHFEENFFFFPFFEKEIHSNRL
jgi:hypothetical protein